LLVDAGAGPGGHALKFDLSLSSLLPLLLVLVLLLALEKAMQRT
jgi:hypothetical protein